MSNVYQPDDENLRKLERDVLIPKKMRKIAWTHCTEELKDFEKCCKGRSVSMVFVCRAQNRAMLDCMKRNFHKEGLRERCTQEYLEERKQYRSSQSYQKHVKKNDRVDS